MNFKGHFQPKAFYDSMRNNVVVPKRKSLKYDGFSLENKTKKQITPLTMFCGCFSDCPSKKLGAE